RSKRDWSSDVCSSDLCGFLFLLSQRDPLNCSVREIICSNSCLISTSSIFLSPQKYLLIDYTPNSKKQKPSFIIDCFCPRSQSTILYSLLTMTIFIFFTTTTWTRVIPADIMFSNVWTALFLFLILAT